jgi:large subunit ribosomal protein L6
LLANAVKGVTEGFSKTLEIEGVGFKALIENDVLVLKIGFSHLVRFPFPEGIKMAVAGNKIKIDGIDKYLVGQTAAKIRSMKKPEPYLGKGIRYEGEVVRRKAGKKAAGTTS